MSARPTALTHALHDYLVAHGVRESAVMRRLREETARHEMAVMQISPEQGALMALLVELTGAARALEVGVFTGYSALVVADAMGAQGRLTALDINAEYAETARRYWAEAGLAERIALRLGDARESLAELRAEGREGSYDFAFIDADKSGYDTYYEHCLALVRPGGLVLIDNSFHHGPDRGARPLGRERPGRGCPEQEDRQRRARDDRDAACGRRADSLPQAPVGG